MQIAIVGAGFAGLGAAKVLTGFGHQVTVFDRAPDIGGVWSRTRRYPGISTQNNKGSYAFSDFPMPRSYPEWPSGEQVHAYLTEYVRYFGIQPYLRLSTEVISARLDPEGGLWTVRTRTGNAALDAVEEVFDYLIVANGSCCDPLIPAYPGTEEFRSAGGRIAHSSEFTDLEQARGRNVVVVGYGKSACDLAVAVGDVAASTTVVARRLLWKMPKLLLNRLNYKYLMLTRMGEALFPWIDSRGFERFLHGRGVGVRNAMVGSLQSQVVRQLGLTRLGLVPPGRFTDIARSTVSLTTDGFYDQVGSGRIKVQRDCRIDRLSVRDGQPSVELSDGTVLPADLVIAGTGFRQRVPFLSDETRRELLDERGDFQLYRQILPLTVPKLAFLGYNSSFFSPLGSELAALWVADHLAGDLDLPPVEDRRAQVEERLRWTEQRTEGKHAHGTNVIPFSMHNIDEILGDVRADVGAGTRLKQWLLPIDPSAYRVVSEQLHRRLDPPKPIGRAWRPALPVRVRDDHSVS